MQVDLLFGCFGLEEVEEVDSQSHLLLLAQVVLDLVVLAHLDAAACGDYGVLAFEGGFSRGSTFVDEDVSDGD